MIKIRRNCKRNEGKSFGVKTEQKQSKNRAKTGVCEILQPLRNRHFAAKPFHSLRPLSAKIFAAAKPFLAHECHFAAQWPSFRSCETAAKLQSVKIPNFAAKAPFCRVFRSCEADFGTRVPFRSTVNLISQLRNDCEIPKRKNFQFRSQSSISQGISRLRNAKPLFGTQVPFGIPVHSFRSCEMDAKPPHLKILQHAHYEQTCHSRTPISVTVGHISITSRSSFHGYHMLF